MIQPVALAHRDYGAPRPDRPALLLLHALFGAGLNWHSHARHFSAAGWHVVVPDLRNHGDSPHVADMRYAAHAADLVALLDRLGIARCIPVGHSMGGKAAMALALRQPARVDRLAVVDIAPVPYGHDFSAVLAAFRAVDLARPRSRREADAAMVAHIAEPAVRQFLLLNLVREGDRWHWRLGLDEIAATMPHITGWDLACPPQYPGPALFLRGEHSDYVQDRHRPAIARCFPSHTLRTIPGAGHWVPAEQPAAFRAALAEFLAESG